MTDALLPCPSCPWRTSNRDTSAIPGYVQAKAERLLNTAGGDDALRPIMACHNSTDKNTVACKGYLAREGWKNLNVRILLALKRIANPSAVIEACESDGVELELDYPSVLGKLSR